MKQQNSPIKKRIRDLSGQKFGHLTAIAPTGEKKNGYVIWRCLCDCGNETTAPSRYLKNGWTTDCGCVEKEKRYKDLTGQRFGKLVVLNVAMETTPEGRKQEVRSENGRVMWDCKCDCGNTIRVPGAQLIAGYRKSCNCLSKPPRKDWIGKRFGRLTVVEYAGKWDGSHHWKCRCDCGNETVVTQSNLKVGHTMSCGCLMDPSATRNFVEGTCIETIRSRKVFSTNTSGVRGVYPIKKTGKWAAQIQFQGKKTYLGSFNTIEEAAKARKKAEEVFEEFLAKYDAGEFDTGKDGFGNNGTEGAESGLAPAGKTAVSENDADHNNNGKPGKKKKRDEQIALFTEYWKKTAV